MKKRMPHTPLLSRSQWIGLAVLLLSLAAVAGLLRWADRLTQPADTPDSLQLTSEKAAELEAALRETEFAYRTAYREDTIPLRLHRFNPNTADSMELLELGLRPWMARNLLRYRGRGGVFRSPGQLRKLYGMTDALYSRIEPYIDIPVVQDTLVGDSLPAMPYPQKRDTVLELNSCDTAELQLLRGIGSYTARQIVNYRHRLGGYCRPEQLLDIEGIRVDTLLHRFTADSTRVEAIDVNHASVERLQRHPYISFRQAKAIYTLRRERFRLHDAAELTAAGILTETELLRLQPYLHFE